MTCIRGLAVLGVAFLMALAPALTPGAQAKPAKDTLAEIKRKPMKFYVAKGKPGACGPGCSEWIAAEDYIDSDAHLRLQRLLWTLPNTRLPVFINSAGGSGRAARLIGTILREHDLAAAVGRTTSVSQGAHHNLVFRGAKCASSCVYILIGAARRDVAPQARVGVHAWKTFGTHKLSREEIDLHNDELRLYTIGKGVDAELIDLSLKTPSTTMHWLSRGELTRFGITVEGFFETGWRLLKNPVGYRVAKSLTRAENESWQTTVIEIGCHSQGSAIITVLRDLTKRELGSRSTLWLKLESGIVVWDSGASLQELKSLQPSEQRRDLRARVVGLLPLLKAADSRALVLEELFTKPEEPSWTRESRFSSDGLNEALVRMLKSCGNAVPEQSSSPSTPQLTPVKAR